MKTSAQKVLTSIFGQLELSMVLKSNRAHKMAMMTK